MTIQGEHSNRHSSKNSKGKTDDGRFQDYFTESLERKPHWVYDPEQSIVNNFMGLYNRQQQKDPQDDWRYTNDRKKKLQLQEALKKNIHVQSTSVAVSPQLSKVNPESRRSTVLLQKNKQIEVSTSPLIRFADLHDDGDDYRMATPD